MLMVVALILLTNRLDVLVKSAVSKDVESNYITTVNGVEEYRFSTVDDYKIVNYYRGNQLLDMGRLVIKTEKEEYKIPLEDITFYTDGREKTNLIIKTNGKVSMYMLYASNEDTKRMKKEFENFYGEKLIFNEGNKENK